MGLQGFIPDNDFLFSDIEEDEELLTYPEVGKETEAAPEYPIEQFTTFQELYDFFLAGITDDMFLELTKEDTYAMLEELMLAAIPYFENCKNDLYNMNMERKHFNFVLTVREKMILRQYMIAQWIGQQLATIDLIRQKYSGSDFKFTSQASHIKQLVALKQDYERQGFHLQRVYDKQEYKSDGGIGSSLHKLMEPPRS